MIARRQVAMAGSMVQLSLSVETDLDEWMGSALEILKMFPPEVQDVLGYAIDLAQAGRKHPDAKPLTGDKAFRGAGVLEAVDTFDGNTYRAVHTVRFAGVVYVLDAFQKKSKVGIKTPLADIRRIRRASKQQHCTMRTTTEPRLVGGRAVSA
jgi:phage-related protein